MTHVFISAFYTNAIGRNMSVIPVPFLNFKNKNQTKETFSSSEVYVGLSMFDGTTT
jgi:hypothetical protein